MPFISKDWRSPGEEWVKTQEGWEKKKILECGRQVFGSPQENTMDSSCSGMAEFSSDQLAFSRMSPQWEDEEDKENISCNDNSTTIKNSLDGSFQPHCHITIKCTREIAGFNGLSDALKRLDFRSAVHDVRRFNYIMKLLDLLISNKLSTLSGCARKQLFHMLEEVAHQVSASQQNIHLLHRLLEQLRTTVECACWGRPLGSTLLWEQHLRTIDRILHIASHIQITEPGEGQFPKLEHLPEACAREIVLRLADHRDLESSALAWPGIRQVVEERRVWRELVQFHFSPRQIEFVLAQAQGDAAATEPPAPAEEAPVDWQAIYHKLRKSFGLREDYAEMIQLCRNCRCLFWKSFGHPCIADQDPEFQEKLENVDKSSLHVPIPPHAFLKFFSL